jgi:magnesium transporter
MNDSDIPQTSAGAHTPFETAAEHLCRRVPTAAPTDTVGDIRTALARRSFECASDVAICRDGVLVGLLPIERLLATADHVAAADVMDDDPPIVAPGVDQELATWKAVQHAEGSLAVVDAEGRFLGILPPWRLLGVLLQEHHEDMARLGGMLKDALSAKTSLQEPIARRLAHRIPWLILGLAGALVAADLVSAFEGAIQARVALAFFLPGVVYIADAVGTQTETLVVRGLSVGIPIRRVLLQESVTGLGIAVGLGLLAAPVTYLRWSDGPLVLVVTIALAASCGTATIVAMALPWVFHRAGYDPAFGSGPLATVVQDLLSIAIYLTTAALVLA